jgi:hypothetical protein
MNNAAALRTLLAVQADQGWGTYDNGAGCASGAAFDG